MGQPPSALRNTRTLFWYATVALLVLVLTLGMAMTIRVVNREIDLSRMQSAFAAGVTHEFKTPITSIRLLMERIAGGRVSSADTLRHYSDTVIRETKRLEDLVNRLLDAHRIQAGEKHYHPAPHCVFEIADAAVRNLREQAAAKQIRIDITADDLIREVELDRTAVQDSLHNLIDNAVKYSPPSTRVEVAITHEPDRLVIQVRDQGIGIEADELDRVFDRFYRGKRGALQTASGAGLGLWLVKAVAGGHGGEVSVKSTPGKGSEFRVQIPIQRSNVCRES